MNQAAAPTPKILTDAEIDTIARLSAKHAEERARLEAEQHNARVQLVERQRGELQAAAGVTGPVVLPKKKR